MAVRRTRQKHTTRSRTAKGRAPRQDAKKVTGWERLPAIRGKPGDCLNYGPRPNMFQPEMRIAVAPLRQSSNSIPGLSDQTVSPSLVRLAEPNPEAEAIAAEDPRSRLANRTL